MSDLLLYGGVLFILIFGGVIGFLFGWYRIPWNKAMIKRTLSKKQYAVICLRTQGGQVRWYVREVSGGEPLIHIGDSQYAPDENYAVYKGSVPIYGFNDWDLKPFKFGGVEGDTEVQRWRNPRHINSILMLMKSLYETLANKRNDLMFYICVGALLFGLLAFAMGYLNYQEIQYMRAEVVAKVAAQGLANQLG